MPRQTTTSSVMAKLGEKGRRAFEAHKADEIEYSSAGELPPGIEGGIAELVECKFDLVKEGKQNAGQPFFYAAGIVKSPVEHNGIRVEGLRTSIMKVIMDTPDSEGQKTVDEKVKWVINEMQKLGAGTKDCSFEDWETLAKALKDSRPHFRFRTWAGQPTEKYPNPRTNHTWNGSCPAPDDAGPGGAVEDGSGAAGEVEESVVGANGKSKPSPKKPSKGSKATPPKEEFDEFGDIDSLLQKANDGDEKARERLGELAVAAGATEEEVADAENWEAVVELIKGGASADEETDTEDTDVIPPEVGEMYEIMVVDPKTKKSKKTQVEVVSVDAKAGTCVVKNAATEKVLKNPIPFADLQTDD